LLSVNAERAMNPASTMKLLTAYAALDLLSPAYVWKTEAYLDGTLKEGVLQGNLVLKGYGDPKFTIEQFWLWLGELRARGLREIRGDLVLDRSYFDLPPHDPGAFDNDPVRAYNVGPDALLLNFNTLHLRYLPEDDHLRVFSEFPPDSIRLDNQIVLRAKGGRCEDWDAAIHVQPDGDGVILQGSYPAMCGERDHNLSVMSHTRYVETAFRALWKALGGTLTGAAREGRASEVAQLFARHDSASLGEIIRDVNKFSNNVMARQLFLTLGAATTETPLSFALSDRTVRGWLQQKQINLTGLTLENGAGLSRRERITASGMTDLLQSAVANPLGAELEASLPVSAVDGTMKKRLRDSAAAGHAHLKTGTLEGVKTIAGYVQSRSGKKWTLVFFINHPNAKNGGAAQDALVEWVAGQ
jgi:D-alanyl-D-alanine carboxypeptidase/D-alanyl-D-alanine-endopeptidase (penicillin-binding protein 4)